MHCWLVLIRHPSHCSCESRLWPLFCSNDQNSVWPKIDIPESWKWVFPPLLTLFWSVGGTFVAMSTRRQRANTLERTTNHNKSVSSGTTVRDGPASETEFCLKHICGFRCFRFIGLWMNKTKRDSQLEAGPSPIVVPLETRPCSEFVLLCCLFYNLDKVFVLFACVFESCPSFVLVGHR